LGFVKNHCAIELHKKHAAAPFFKEGVYIKTLLQLIRQTGSMGQKVSNTSVRDSNLHKKLLTQRT